MKYVVYECCEYWYDEVGWIILVELYMFVVCGLLLKNCVSLKYDKCGEVVEEYMLIGWFVYIYDEFGNCVSMMIFGGCMIDWLYFGLEYVY